MRVVFLALILALIPLAGIAYIALFGALLTVDGLFMSLILLTMSGIFLLGALLEMKARREPKETPTKSSASAPSTRTATAAGPAPTMAASPSAGEIRREAGTVVKLDYFEAPVGQPNKSMVTFQPNGATNAQVIVLQGDLRNVLPLGKRVRISYESSPEGNRLVSVE